jgi:hypothetical protein
MRAHVLECPINQHRDHKNYNKPQEVILIARFYASGIKNDNNDPR